MMILFFPSIHTHTQKPKKVWCIIIIFIIYFVLFFVSPSLSLSLSCIFFSHYTYRVPFTLHTPHKKRFFVSPSLSLSLSLSSSCILFTNSHTSCTLSFLRYTLHNTKKISLNMGSRLEDNKNVTDWTVFVDPDTDEHYYSSKSKKALVHNIPVGIKARYAPFPLSTTLLPNTRNQNQSQKQRLRLVKGNEHAFKRGMWWFGTCGDMSSMGDG